MRTMTAIMGLVGGIAFAGAALAHTPYLKPTTFGPDKPFVTLEAALTEGNFFVPEFPIRGPGDYWVTDNSGTPAKAGVVTMLKEFASVEVPLPADGTYRISTGERSGRTMKWAKIGGAWKIVRPAGAPAGGEMADRAVSEANVPAGAETLDATIFLRSDTYVTRGAPNRGALKPTGQGIEVQPITHPNEAFVGEAFKFRVLNDGKPLPASAFSIARANDAYAEKRYAYSGKTDASGAAAVTFAQPGAYVLQVDYPIRAEGAAVPVPRSTVYSLTFEVTRYPTRLGARVIRALFPNVRPHA